MHRGSTTGRSATLSLVRVRSPRRSNQSPCRHYESRRRIGARERVPNLSNLQRWTDAFPMRGCSLRLKLGAKVASACLTTLALPCRLNLESSSTPSDAAASTRRPLAIRRVSYSARSHPCQLADVRSRRHVFCRHPLRCAYRHLTSATGSHRPAWSPPLLRSCGSVRASSGFPHLEPTTSAAPFIQLVIHVPLL